MKNILLILLFIGIYCNAQVSVIPYMPKQSNFTNDYTAATWNLSSFSFDGTNNIFTGNSTASTILNNAIVGSNKQFTLSLYVKKGINAVTNQLFCRDNSTTAVRQIIVFYDGSNKMRFQVYTNSTNHIVWVSTNTFSELREWNEWTFVYNGTLSATSRITAYRNGIAEAGAITQTGTFTTINSTTVNPVEIGSRSNAASYSTCKISQVALFNTNLSAANIAILHNNRVPFDITTNSTLNANLVMYLVADKSATFSANWTWNDTKGSSVFTSTNMVSGDQVADAPALKQISICMIEGQSNACGRVTIPGALPTKFSPQVEWNKVWTGSTWAGQGYTANNNQYIETAGQYGIEFYLGDKLNRYFKKTIYTFKVAKGSSYLAYAGDPNNWRYPDAFQGLGGSNYQRLHNTELPALKEWCLANGYTITKFIDIRLQGEADAQVLAYANAYSTNLEDYFTRASTGMHTYITANFYIQPYTYHCLLSSQQTAASQVYKSTVNTAITTVVGNLSTYRRTVNTDAATVSQTDSIHYDDFGVRTIADSLYKKIITDNSL
jgi:hypothetical protein